MGSFSCLHLDDEELIKEYFDMLKKKGNFGIEGYFNSSLVKFE